MQVQQQTEETARFFNQWTIYQGVIAGNYMVHDEVLITLKNFFDRHCAGGVIDFLDLGCGDACIAAKALYGRNLGQYFGVDLSPTALQFAQINLQALVGNKHFINQDLAVAINDFRQTFDVICAGYSLHHLQHDDKQLLFNACAKALKPQCYFLMYDLVRIEPETRQQCLQRHWQYYQQWTLSEATLEHIKNHVFEQDYAESAQVLSELSNKAGFKRMQTLFVDPDQLFAVYCFFK